MIQQLGIYFLPLRCTIIEENLVPQKYVLLECNLHTRRSRIFVHLKAARLTVQKVEGFSVLSCRTVLQMDFPSPKHQEWVTLIFPRKPFQIYLEKKIANEKDFKNILHKDFFSFSS